MTVLSQRIFRISILTISALIACDAAFAEDWPQYRGPAGDGKSSETIGNVDWSGGVVPAWKIDTPLGFSSFSVSGGRAFTLIVRPNDAGNDSETIIAINAETGDEIWSASLGKNTYAGGGGKAGAPGNRGGDGPRSTPTCDGDFVYVYDANLVLYCFAAATGNRVWTQDVMADFAGRNIKWSSSASPVVVENHVIVFGGGPGQSLLAFDKLTGELAWETANEKMTHATPTVATIDAMKQVIFMTQSGPIAIDPKNGNEVWRTKFPYSTSTAASPVVAGNLVYCSAGYGVGAGVFEAQGKQEPREVWFEPNKLMNHWSTPVVYQGHLYGMYEFKKYGRAPLQCVELATGEIKWKEDGYGPGNVILVGDTLVALSDAGEVAIVKAEPSEYIELARAKVIDGKCWSTPAFSDGKLYVRSTKEGICIEL